MTIKYYINQIKFNPFYNYWLIPHKFIYEFGMSEVENFLFLLTKYIITRVQENYSTLIEIYSAIKNCRKSTPSLVSFTVSCRGKLSLWFKSKDFLTSWLSHFPIVLLVVLKCMFYLNFTNVTPISGTMCTIIDSKINYRVVFFNSYTVSYG